MQQLDLSEDKKLGEVYRDLIVKFEEDHANIMD